MRTILYVLLLAIFLNACGSIPQATKNIAINTSNIGAIGINKTSFFKAEFTKIGESNLSGSLELSLKKIPFNKSAFNSYTSYKKQKGEAVTLQYADSVATKPNYYILSLTDLIGLKSELNGSNNKAVLEYLASDEKYGVLTQISVLAHPSFEDWMDNTTGLYLAEHHNQLSLEFKNSKQSQFLAFEQLEIFDHEFSTFCWKENVYGKPEIAVIAVNGNSCPKNTEKKAVKLNDEKSYLKL
ncbi:MAG: hypothetical protein COA50_11590 [Flavobacteriaceae bacterium]|nr:MAG: hypothetical protein COA50_11590 [Flavobacteriaceae bacterium]